MNRLDELKYTGEQIRAILLHTQGFAEEDICETIGIDSGTLKVWLNSETVNKIVDQEWQDSVSAIRGVTLRLTLKALAVLDMKLIEEGKPNVQIAALILNFFGKVGVLLEHVEARKELMKIKQELAEDKLLKGIEP